MGRPLNKKYFANTNLAQFGTAGVGGESVASVANATGLTGMTYLTGGPYTILAADIGAPQITGGVKPVLTFQPTSATAGTVTVVSAGSGYTSAPTITVRGSLAAGSGTATPTATLTSGATARQNGIKCEAQIGSGGSEVTTGDIIKQVNTRSYKVQTSDGTAVCKLVATANLGANEMSITATDANSNGYFVTKLTAHKATLTRKVSGDGDFATGTAVQWTFSAATATAVSIENQ
jgi:hypothetical protein